MKYFIEYAMQFVGAPYLWGGANPISGFDCSGFTDEILSSVGMGLPGKPNAQQLFSHYFIHGLGDIKSAGALCFYGASQNEISHVALMIDENRIIEAAGGTSKTLNRDVASQQNAFVKIRLWNYRSDFVGTIMPNYPDWVKNG